MIDRIRSVGVAPLRNARPPSRRPIRIGSLLELSNSQALSACQKNQPACSNERTRRFRTLSGGTSCPPFATRALMRSSCSSASRKKTKTKQISNRAPLPYPPDDDTWTMKAPSRRRSSGALQSTSRATSRSVAQRRDSLQSTRAVRHYATLRSAGRD